MVNFFPAELQQFVRDELAEGKYADEQALVVAAVQRLRDDEGNVRRFRQGLEQRLAELDAGGDISLNDDAALDAFFSEIEAEALATTPSHGR